MCKSLVQAHFAHHCTLHILESKKKGKKMYDVIYTRVSTDEQGKDDKYSLDLQADRCLDLLSNIGSDNELKIFREDYSGYEESRPELNKVKGLMKAGQVQRLLFLRVDRLSRKSSHIDNLRENYFIPHDIEVYSTDLNKWEWTPHQIYMQQTLSNFSQLWGTMLKQVMYDGKMSLLDKGSVMTHGRPPLGYTEVKDEATNIRTLEPNPIESCIIRDIFQWFVYEELSLHAIARRLNKNKVPTYSDLRNNTFRSGWKNPKKKVIWNYVTVKNILSNKTYMGKWQWGKKEDALHSQVVDVPAIIDKDTFSLSQKYLADSKHRKSKKLGRKNSFAFLMGKRLKCTCGYTMNSRQVSYTSTEGKKKHYHYYACSSRKAKDLNYLCDNGHRFRSDDIDRIAWGWVREIIFNREYLEHQVNTYLDEQEVKIKPLIERIEQYQLLKKKAEVKRERLLDLFLDSELSKEILTVKQKELDKQLADYKAELAELKLKLNRVDLIQDRAQWEKEFWLMVDGFYSLYQEENNLGSKSQHRLFREFDVQGTIVEIKNGIAKPSLYQKHIEADMTDGLYMFLSCKFNLKEEIKSEFFAQRLNYCTV